MFMVEGEETTISNLKKNSLNLEDSLILSCSLVGVYFSRAGHFLDLLFPRQRLTKRGWRIARLLQRNAQRRLGHEAGGVELHGKRLVRRNSRRIAMRKNARRVGREFARRRGTQLGRRRTWRFRRRAARRRRRRYGRRSARYDPRIGER